MPHSFADAALALRVEAGWSWAAEASTLAYGAARPDVGAAVIRPEGGVSVATYYGPGSPLSQAVGLGLAGPVGDEALDRLEAFYDGLETPASIEVATLSDPAFLPALSKRGYKIGETTHMLVRPVEPGDAASGPDGALRVDLVDPGDAATRAACNAVILRGFFEGPDDPPEGMADIMDAMTGAPGTSVWLARVSGEPAGGAALLVREGLAMLAGDATAPASRRLGVQLALIRARLAEAARLGCDLATACTNPGSPSQRNYERMGFRLAYARVLMVRDPRAGG